MSVLKWKKAENDWVTLYGTVLNNRLRRDKNLADLTDKSEALKNLELTGDVSSHNHDSRYQHQIDTLTNELNNETANRKQWEKNYDEVIIAGIRSNIESTLQDYGASIKQEKTDRIDGDESVRTDMGKVQQELEGKIDEEAAAREQAYKDASNLVSREAEKREEAIRQEVADRNIADDKVKALVSQEAADRAAAISAEEKARDAAIDKKASEVESLIKEEENNRNLAISQESRKLSNTISQEVSRRTQDVQQLQQADTNLNNLINQKYNDMKTYVDTLIGNIVVGTASPQNPQNNKTIWFYTADGEESIRVMKDNKWVTFGASYL